MVAITLDHLCKGYGQVTVLDDICLDIADGEFMILVGPSGCGKSTLLRCIAGLNTIDAGAIRFDGRPVDNLPPQARDLSMVFQNYALYPHLTVAENLAFGLKLKGVPREEIARRVAWAAGMLSITPYLERRPRALSGGQRQRVAMGRAMVKQSNAFLFDEPLSNLDAKLRVQMRKEIRNLQRTLGTTAVYVTHDQIEAMTMGDRIVVMNGGRIEQVGTPLALYADPDTLFVAGFIGSPPMNLVPGQAQGKEVRLADGTLLRTQVAASGEVVVGMRPEHLFEPHPEANALSLALRTRQELGAAVSYFGELGGVEIEAHGPQPVPVIEGRIALSIPPERLLLFKDGARLR